MEEKLWAVILAEENDNTIKHIKMDNRYISKQDGITEKKINIPLE